MPEIKKEHLIRLAVPGTVAVTGGGKTNGPAMRRAATGAARLLPLYGRRLVKRAIVFAALMLIAGAVGAPAPA